MLDEAGGQLVAKALAGAWRETPPRCDLTADEIETVTPLLTGSGAASLGWRRLGSGAEAYGSATLRDSARLLALQDTRHQLAVAGLDALLAKGGIQAILFKGWAASLDYAETWLRPYGDFDLIVRPEDLARVLESLSTSAIGTMSNPRRGQLSLGTGEGHGPIDVDLHASLPPFYASPIERLFQRAAPSPFKTLLLPSAEDHLRLVAIHFLKHGGWRPLWLCDVAAMIERNGERIAWTEVFTGKPRTDEWLSATFLAACRLLGCHRHHLPEGIRAAEPPGWFLSAVLRQWSQPFGGRYVRQSGVNLKAWTAHFGASWTNPVLIRFVGGFDVSGPASFTQKAGYFTLRARARMAELFH